MVRETAFVCVRKRLFCTATFGCLLWVAAAPTAQGPSPLSFEVASVRRNTSGDEAMSVRVGEGGRFTATNMPLRQLVRYAYELQDSELVGGSREQLAQRFDVLATPPRASSTREVRVMLQSLLATRFNLQLRSDTRELPVYYLEAADAGRRLGPHLRPSAAKCDVAAAGDFGAANADPSRTCGYLGPAPGASLAAGRSMMALRGITMAGFARLLEGPVRRRIINRTALEGVFDGEFDFSAELGPPPPPPGSPDPLDRQALPSIFTALPEQLGLNLQASTAPVPVLVIERVEAPTPD
ncbi:MAG: TIGR03435 family protein [Vicinamibacterales bacterium]